MLTAGEGPKGSESTAELSGGMDRVLDGATITASDQALRESEERYRTLAESMPFIVWQAEAGGAAMYANRFFQEYTGWTAEDLRTRDWSQLIYPEDRDEAQQRFVTSLRGATPLSATLRLRRKDGLFRWFKFSGTPVRVPGQEAVRWVGTGMDVDDELQAKRELSRMRDDLALQVAGLKRLHELGMRLGAIRDLPPSLDAILRSIASFHGAEMGYVALYDETSQKLHAGMSLGFSQETLDGVANIAPAEGAGASGSCFFTRKRVVIDDTDADPRYAELAQYARAAGFRAVHATPIITRSGKILGCICVHFPHPRQPSEREMQFSDMCAKLAADAIDAARSAEAVRENERKIRRILDSSVQFMWLLDVEGRLLEANSTSLSFVGKPREAMIGRPFWQTEWWDVSRDLQDSVRDAVRRAAKGATVRMESKHRGMGGKIIDVEFSLKPIRDSAGEIVNLLPEARDITDRKRIEKALKESKESAEAANLSKDRFLAMLSHELRTPLAPVLITVSGMEGDPMLPDSVRRDIAMVRRNVELESKLIDDLLDVSRIASGKLRLALEPLDINEAMRLVCSICRPQVLEKGLRLEVRLDPEAGRALADPARLQQVMWNLLKNAIKFTPEGGAIAVTTFRPVDGRARFQVRDTGVGIEQAALDHVFNAFEQGGERITRKFGGLGLGLAISKSLIDQHNGNITAESPGPDRGATFTVDLPAAAPLTALPRGPNEQASSKERNVKLLLVEDHEDTATALTKFLQVAGFAVKRAATSAEALERLSKDHFDLVISDIGLPDISGYDLMKKIRDRWPLLGIAMSGYGMEEDIRRSRESGFSEHLVKPIKLTVLEETINRLLRRDHSGASAPA